MWAGRRETTPQSRGLIVTQRDRRRALCATGLLCAQEAASGLESLGLSVYVVT